MTRFRFRLSLAIVASAGIMTAAAAPKLPPDENTADYACAMVSTEILTGHKVGNLEDNIRLCNTRNHDCLTTREFIRQRNGGQVPPGLTCEQP